MHLGGATPQVPFIKKAKEMGCHVIVCDMNPECPGASLADAFHSVSTGDLNEVLRVAKSENIDGVTTYASDPSALAVSYVGNNMGLPSNPFSSVEILTRKDKLRKFLHINGFSAPRSESFSDPDSMAETAKSFNGAILVKPSDSSGSRGITQFNSARQPEDILKKAFNAAHHFSASGNVILESFVFRKGYQVAGDGFLVDGDLVFRCFANEHFHDSFNPLTPIGESFPSVLEKEKADQAHEVLQSILSLLEMKMGAVNFDFLFTENDEIYVIEIGPRNGGNMIPEITTLSTGVNMIEYTVKSALGEDCSDIAMMPSKGFYSSHVIHVKKPGILRDVSFSEEIGGNIIEQRIYCEPGTVFTKENIRNHRLIGALALRFENMDEMLMKMDTLDNHVDVKIDPAV